MKPLERLREPSSWAGFGLLFQGLAALIASKGLDPTAWASIASGVAAVAMPERSKAP